MFGIDMLAAAGVLTLATNPVTCTVPRAPVITVRPVTDKPRRIDSKSIAQLGRQKADTISPYGKNVEQLIFGLHVGSLKLSASTQIGYQVYEWLEVSCLYYNAVTIEIRLSPAIYVVKEFKPGTCAHDAVLTHEKKHAAIDREIVKKYAPLIGGQVKKAINAVGALGPYPLEEMKAANQRMIRHIQTAISMLELQMTEEQTRRQQAVDSLEEYERVSTYIRDVCKVDVQDFARGR